MNGPTLRLDLLTEYGAPLGPGAAFRQEVVRYIERCHLEDGGYFFARVPPSSGMDTFFAVKGLSLLGLRPDRPEAVAGFFLGDLRGGTSVGLSGIFAATEVLGELGCLTDEFKSHARQRVMSLRNEAGGFGACEDIDVEVPSELQDTFRAVRVLSIIGARFDREKVKRFTVGFLRPDGGYGSGGLSTLASTFYALAIQKMLGTEAVSPRATRDYLRKREENWQVQFIEEVYWLVMGLASLGEKTRFPDKVVRFVMECRRQNGGFARATVIGIPTLEYTYYALAVLKEAGVM
ncbi:MAG: hypothetical protein N2506_03335 [Dehalococcoidales bacterium]|nr:hypothetical protein [Dehalococcoidales bacterium]